MLKSMTKGACALAAALTFVGSAAFADNHTVEIADGAYLPIVSYVNRGDNIVFKNESDFDHTIGGTMEATGEEWTSGVIPPGGQFVLNIDNKMALTFGGEDAEGLMMVGEWSYEPAPLDSDS